MSRSGKRNEMIAAEVDREFVRSAPLRIPSRVLAQAFFEGRPPMTRGRALDTVTRKHLGLVAKNWPNSSVDRPIFIVGVGRSGTTLLGRILASGQGVGYLKEPKAIWSAAVPAEDISGFYSVTGRFVLGENDATDSVRQSVGAMYNWFGTLTRSSRIVDKYPEMTYRVPFLRALFPDAKIIAIVRRPDAVVKSIVEYSAAMADDRGNWWGVDDAKWHRMVEQLLGDARPTAIPETVDRHTDDPAIRARAEWVLGAEHLVSSKENIDLFVRFEDLLANPVETLEEVSRVCELPSDGIVKYGSTVVGAPKMTPAASVEEALHPLVEALGYQGVQS